jgi:hypothetical protein
MKEQHSRIEKESHHSSLSLSPIIHQSLTRIWPTKTASRSKKKLDNFLTQSWRLFCLWVLTIVVLESWISTIVFLAAAECSRPGGSDEE